MRRRRVRDDAGDTLLELLIAIVLLGGVGVAMLSFLTTTVIGSGTYRRQATMDTALKTAASEVVTQIDANASQAFACPPAAYWSGTYGPSASFWSLPHKYSASVISPLTYWSGTGRTTSCGLKDPLVLTVKVIGPRSASTLRFIVDDPLARTVSVATVAKKLQFLTLPTKPAAGEQFAPPIAVAVEATTGAIITGDISHMALSVTGPGDLSSTCNPSGVEDYGVFTFRDCSVTQAGTYTITATDSTDGLSATSRTIVVGDVPTVQVTDNSKTITAGEQLTFVATVTGVSGQTPPRGALTWTVSLATGAPVPCSSTTTRTSANVATYTCSILSAPAGTYNTTAAYRGDQTSRPPYEPATGFVTTVVVTGVPFTSFTTVTTITTPVQYGAETETFSGHVTGHTTVGRPTGTVTVKTTSGATICTATLGTGTGDESSFSCSYSSTTVLGAGNYTVFAHYGGGSSSTPDYLYSASTSMPMQPLAVKKLTRSSTITLTTPAPVNVGTESETLKGRVTGQTADGYPRGTVTVTTTTGVQLCSTNLGTGTGDSVTFTCKFTGGKLAAHTYHLTATFTPATTSSSTPDYSYTGSTTTSKTLTVKQLVKSTITLTTPAPVNVGTESETLKGRVTGQTADGYPRGTVTVTTTTGVQLCSTNLGTGTGDSVTFTCKFTGGKLAAHTYHLTATFTPATTSSSTPDYSYTGSTTTSKTLTVKQLVKSTITLTTPAPVNVGTESETLKGRVTGQTADGYPRGTVTVTTTTGVQLCSTNLGTGTGDSVTFTCKFTGGKLAAHTYHLTATFTPATTSSSTPDYSYTGSTTTSKTLTVKQLVKSTITLTTPAPVNVGTESETLKGRVTGQTADGYPRGTVTVTTTTGVQLCSTNLGTGTGDSVTFTCKFTGGKLAAHTYHLTATFTPATTSSSTPDYSYTGSTTTSKTLTVNR